MPPTLAIHARRVALGATLLVALAGCRRAEPPTWAERTTAQQDEPWYREHMLGAYEAAGIKDPRWDDAMRQLLREVAAFRAREGKTPPPSLIKWLDETAARGCTDPLFRYYCARYDQYRGRGARQRIDRVTAYAGMRASRYGALEKFLAAWRAGEQLEQSNPAVSNRYYAEGIAYLKTALAEPTLLPREAATSGMLVLNNLSFLKDPALLRHAAAELLPVLAERWPQDADVLRTVGDAHVSLAWAARGKDWASNVTSEGWAGFEDHLAQAERALETSWALAPHPLTANRMLSVELGQGRGRERMELWFQRAMQLDPANEWACDQKVRYLMPRWHGSTEELLAFAHECATNRAWGGRTPLAALSALESIALDLPEEERAAFWQRPEVWPLARAAYERYFQLNPDDVVSRQLYVRDAYRAHAWKDLNRQLKKLGPISLEFFGGEAAFSRMLEDASNHR